MELSRTLHDVKNSCRPFATLLQHATAFLGHSALIPRQGLFLVKVRFSANSPEAARLPQRRQISGAGRPPDGCDGDARTGGKLAGRQQFILRQCPKSLLALFPRGAAALPLRAHAQTLPLQTAEKLPDRGSGNSLAMMRVRSPVGGDHAGFDPLPKQPHAHPEEPRHAGDRPHFALCFAQSRFNLGLPLPNGVRSP